MPLTISGSTGIAGVDGSASTPAVQGTDTNTGIFFPAADTIAFGEGGSEAMRIDSSGNVGIGTSSPQSRLHVVGASAAPFPTGGDGLHLGAFGGYASMEFCGTTAAYLDFNKGDGTDFLGRVLYDTNNNNFVFYTNGNNERARIDSSGNFLFNSGYGSAATAYGCRAWVNFNGTGVVAIRSSGNVTSITDNGVGDYTVNFTNAMPDANYSSVGACAKNDTNNDGNQTVQVGGYSGALQTTSACRIRTVYITGFSAQDSPQVTFAAFR